MAAPPMASTSDEPKTAAVSAKPAPAPAQAATTPGSVPATVTSQAAAKPAKPTLKIGAPVQASLGSSPFNRVPSPPSPAEAVIAPPPAATLSGPASAPPAKPMAAAANPAAAAVTPAAVPMPAPFPFARAAAAPGPTLAFAGPGQPLSGTPKTAAKAEPVITGALTPPAAQPETLPPFAAPSLPAGKEEIAGLVAKHAAANGVPFELAHGVVMVESRYNARATGPGGHVGLMQISYPTAVSLGYSGGRAGLYEPNVNLTYGMKYLGGAYKASGGDMCGAVSKYQGGHRTVGVTRAGAAYCGKIRKIMAGKASGPRAVARSVRAETKKTASAD
jgi:soluble lytic murein transglycosylase-like protein